MKKLLAMILLLSGIAMNAKIHRVVEIQEEVVIVKDGKEPFAQKSRIKVPVI